MSAPVIYNEDDKALPFADYLSAAPSVLTTEPFFLGSIDTQQRGVPGDISLDVHLATDGAWLEVGPLRFNRRATLRLHKLLDIAATCITARPAPVPTPESGRGIAGWGLARSAAELSDSGLSEGEGRP